MFLLDKINNYNVILASNSPRRRELLADLGVRFTVQVIEGIDESYPPTLPALDIAEHISRKKADAYAARMGDNDLIITADTVVILGDKVLGKPADEDEARLMLKQLSGKKHLVVTGVTLACRKGTRSFSAVTEVEFAGLSPEAIDYYVDNYRPLDKAGAYGIQEWIGCAGIKGISGSFYNVMGLPLHRLYTELEQFLA